LLEPIFIWMFFEYRRRLDEKPRLASWVYTMVFVCFVSLCLAEFMLLMLAIIAYFIELPKSLNFVIASMVASYVMPIIFLMMSPLVAMLTIRPEEEETAGGDYQQGPSQFYTEYIGPELPPPAYQSVHIYTTAAPTAGSYQPLLTNYN